MDTFLPSGKTVSTTGFTNYLGGAPSKARVLRVCEEKVGEPCVLINGASNWHCPSETMPSRWPAADLKVAVYHDGISGIVRSGFVLRESDLSELAERFQAKFGVPLALPFHLRESRRRGGVRLFRLIGEEAVESVFPLTPEERP